MSRSIAVFDLDGTITKGDTYVAFLVYMLRHRLSRVPRAGMLPLAVVRFRLGLLSRDGLKTALLTAVASGSNRGEVARLVDSFIPGYVARAVKRGALARIEWHRQRGHKLVLASASLDLYAAAIGREFQFHQTVSTQAAWISDRLTGRLDGPNLRGEAKLAAIRAVVESEVPRPEVFVYSDHHSDLPLLRYADHPVAVDPSPRLRATAAAEGMTIEYW